MSMYHGFLKCDYNTEGAACTLYIHVCLWHMTRQGCWPRNPDDSGAFIEYKTR